MKAFFFFLFFFSISLAGSTQEIVSPNKHIKVVISAQKASANVTVYPVYFRVLYKKEGLLLFWKFKITEIIK